jgi:hypothetical protein
MEPHAPMLMRAVFSNNVGWNTCLTVLHRVVCWTSKELVLLFVSGAMATRGM